VIAAARSKHHRKHRNDKQKGECFFHKISSVLKRFVVYIIHRFAPFVKSASNANAEIPLVSLVLLAQAPKARQAQNDTAGRSRTDLVRSILHNFP
jgi:hypothetical protein